MSDFLYKKLKFDHVDVITQQLLEIAQEFNPGEYKTSTFSVDLLKDRVPLLLEQFNNMNLQCDVFREFVSQPYVGIGIHQDGSPGWPKKYALNWPIENCKNTYMKWWDFDKNPIVLTDTLDTAFTTALIIYSRQNAIEVGSLEILEPVLVNINKHHSVENNINSIRRMVSFRFTKEPEWLIE